MKLSTQEKELYANKLMDLSNLIVTGVILSIILGQEGICYDLTIAAFFGYIICLIISHLLFRR